MGLSEERGSKVFLKAVVGELVVFRRAEVDGLAIIAEPKAGDAIGVCAGGSKVEVLVEGQVSSGRNNGAGRNTVFGQVGGGVAEEPSSYVDWFGGAVEELDPIRCRSGVGEDFVDHDSFAKGEGVVGFLVMVSGSHIDTGEIGVGGVCRVAGVDGG